MMTARPRCQAAWHELLAALREEMPELFEDEFARQQLLALDKLFDPPIEYDDDGQPVAEPAHPARGE